MLFRSRGFTRGSLIKNLPADAGDVGLILGQEDPPDQSRHPKGNMAPAAGKALVTTKSQERHSKGSAGVKIHIRHWKKGISQSIRVNSIL